MNFDSLSNGKIRNIAMRFVLRFTTLEIDMDLSELLIQSDTQLETSWEIHLWCENVSFLPRIGGGSSLVETIFGL